MRERVYLTTPIVSVVSCIFCSPETSSGRPKILSPLVGRNQRASNMIGKQQSHLYSPIVDSGKPNYNRTVPKILGSCVAIVIGILLILVFASDAGSAGILIEVCAKATFLLSLIFASKKLCPVVTLTGIVGIVASRPFFVKYTVGAYNFLHPNHGFLDFCDALRTDPTELKTLLPSGKHHDDVFQFAGLGDGYMDTLASALEVHFDRYGRNQTESFRTVETLNLIANLFGAKGVASLSRALAHPDAYTKSLLIGRNPNIDDASVASIADLLEHGNQKLVDLFIGDHPSAITGRGFATLFSAVSARKMAIIGINYNHQIRYHLKDIGKGKELKGISLTGTKITDSNIPILVEAVQKTDITTLALTDVKIGPAGVRALLPLTTQLTELRLSLNHRIGDAGAKILAAALKNPNCTIETLNLLGSAICEEGARAFLDILPKSTRLKYLYVDDSKCIDESTSIAIDNLSKMGA